MPPSRRLPTNGVIASLVGGLVAALIGAWCWHDAHEKAEVVERWSSYDQTVMGTVIESNQIRRTGACAVRAEYDVRGKRHETRDQEPCAHDAGDRVRLRYAEGHPDKAFIDNRAGQSQETRGRYFAALLSGLVALVLLVGGALALEPRSQVTPPHVARASDRPAATVRTNMDGGTPWSNANGPDVTGAAVKLPGDPSANECATPLKSRVPGIVMP